MTESAPSKAGNSIDIPTALAKGRRAQLSLQRTVDLLKTAHKAGRTDYWINFLPIDIFKYVQLFRARREANRAKKLLDSFRESLGDMQLESEIAARVELNPGVILADVVEDFLGDLMAQSGIEKSKRGTNIALSRLRRVLRALEEILSGPPPGAPSDAAAS